MSYNRSVYYFSRMFNLLRSKRFTQFHQLGYFVYIVPKYAAVLKCSWNDYNHQVSINLPHLLVKVYTLPSQSQ